MNKKQPQELLFSVTASDCEWKYTKGTGPGGQKKSKTSSAVHCFHRPSGAHGYSEASRSQLDNRKDAFLKMANSNEFKTWHRLEISRRTGEMLKIDQKVQEELTKVKTEVKVAGKWTEVNPHQLSNGDGEANGNI